VAPFAVAEHEEASEPDEGEVDPFDAPNDFDRVVLSFARDGIVCGRGEVKYCGEIGSGADHFDKEGAPGSARSL